MTPRDAFPWMTMPRFSLMQVTQCPGAAFHRYMTDEEKAGDILESALGIVVMTWSLKGRERVNRTACHIYNMICKILIAAFVDFQLLGRCDF